MLQNIKSLIVVLVLAAPAFYVGLQFTSSSISHREFATWRNAWFAVTIAAFLSGNFFISSVITAFICFYARSIGTASVALYFILLFALPPVNVQVGGLGILNALIDLNNARLLAIFLLLPILFMSARLSRGNARTYLMPDMLIVGYVLLMIVLEFRRSEFTQVLRVATRYMLDVLIPYFTCSRAIRNIADFRKVLLAFVIAVLPLSLIAVFETLKGWHLYDVIGNDWGENVSGYSQRGGMLRAGATATSIVLGYVIMVAMGCLLAVWSTIPSQKFAGSIMAIMVVGLIATLSRGPWVGTAVLVVAYLATGLNAAANLTKFVVIAAAVTLILIVTPVGERIIDLLPFVGTIDARNVEYRQELYETAVVVISRSPWFGSVDYLSTPEMQDWIRSHGFVDIVNTYLGIVLEVGLIGLGLFLGFFATILIGLWRVLRSNTVPGNDIRVYARASIAILGAILVTIATVSSIQFIPYVYWSFAGLCVALVRIAYRGRKAARRVAPVSSALA